MRQVGDARGRGRPAAEGARNQESRPAGHSGAYAADLLGLAGAEPVLDDPATRYPRIEQDTVAALRPELVDGRALTWYGPRMPAALAAFRALLTA